MRRIYIEFYVGLVVVFFITMTSFFVFEEGVLGDYDAILEQRRADGIVDMLDTIEATSGTDAALQVLRGYVDKVELALDVYNTHTVPPAVASYFNQQSREADVFYDDEDTLWLKLSDHETFYSMQNAPDSGLHQAVAFNDDLLVVFLFAGFAIYSFFMVWFLSRRVRALEKTAHQFADGNLSARASTRSHQRVGTLNRTFNYMADRIGNLVTSSRALTNAVAHELRSPLFRIQWQAELLAESQLDSKQKKK